MQICRRRLVPSFLGLALISGCQLDSRKQAVNEIVQFGLSSPFTMIESDGSAMELAVADSALDDFNRIFDYLPQSNDVDSVRYFYNAWMERFLSDAAFSSVENLEYSLAADTLVATVAVRRPELLNYDRFVVSRVTDLDSADLASRIQRAKRELQVRDTLTLRVVAGPRVVAWSSAIRRRDSVSTVIVASEADSGQVTVAAAPVTAAKQSDSSRATPPAVPANLVDPGDSTLNMWITVNANVRSGPGMDHDVIATRPAGTEVVADSLTEGWYHINAGGKLAGFISGTLVSTDTVQAAPRAAERERETEPRPARRSKEARSETD